ncbi:helix-turn-helix domain-containing protein [Streptomyces sp. NPDC055099]
MSALNATQASTTGKGSRRCQGCGFRLSRYNREDHCTACVRSVFTRQPVHPAVPARLWCLPVIQQALFNREFGELCRLIRKLGQLRQEDVAAFTGLSQAFLSMLESGNRKLTNIDKIVQLLEGLQAPQELTGPMLRSRGHRDASLPTESASIRLLDTNRCYMTPVISPPRCASPHSIQHR